VGEAWYAQNGGLRFKCLPGCSSCCGSGGFVALSAQEFAAVCEFLDKAPAELLGEKIEQCNGHFVMKMTAGGRCPFVTEHGCEIYDARPVQCWTFPFWNTYLGSPDAWSEAFKRCPGVGIGPVHPVGEIRAAADAMERSTTV